jgi:hypothetical protein
MAQRSKSLSEMKRYGLPKPTVKRALLEVYQTVVLDQQR